MKWYLLIEVAAMAWIGFSVRLLAYKALGALSVAADWTRWMEGMFGPLSSVFASVAMLLVAVAFVAGALYYAPNILPVLLR